MGRLDDIHERMIADFRRLYGANPLHLIGHLVVFAIAGFAIVQILGGGAWVNWIAWFLGAALLHDLVLLPLYSALDRGLGKISGGGGWSRRLRVPVINHLRTPAAISGILLIVYFPLILGLSSRNYRNDTGHQLSGYTRNWLLITAALFIVSGVIYALRVRPRRTRAPGTPPSAREHSDT
jgi:hypothetical protein